MHHNKYYHVGSVYHTVMCELTLSGLYAE